MRNVTILGAALVMSVFGMPASGCADAASDDADRFREAVPQQEEVALRVPGASAAGTTTKSAGIRTANGPSAGSTANVARYYQFTRDLTGAVDFTTAALLGGILAIVHSPPTSIDAKRAVWGPGSDNALAPAVWRFTVDEVGNAEYDYVLEGQPKSGGAWLSVMKGHSYGRSRPEHKQGWFEVDNDAYKTLEPTRGRDEGKTKVTFNLSQLPASIAVEVRPPAGKGWADLEVIHGQAGSGSVAIASLGDLDLSKATKLEDVTLFSRWTSDGSGRADVSMKNGDLPVTVDATECWSPSFVRVFYKDTVDFEPPTGEANACAFTTKQ